MAIDVTCTVRLDLLPLALDEQKDLIIKTGEHWPYSVVLEWDGVQYQVSAGDLLNAIVKAASAGC